jgi:hypothetical protein
LLALALALALAVTIVLAVVALALPEAVSDAVRLHLPGELETDAGIAIPLDHRAPDNESNHPHIYFSLSKAFKLCPEMVHIGCS